MSHTETAWAGLTWPFRQFWAFLVNLWTWLTERLELRNIVLPAIYDSLVWLTNQLPLALGGGDPGEMIEASFVLAVATFFTGIVTGGLAWVLISVWLLLASSASLGLRRLSRSTGRSASGASVIRTLWGCSRR